MRRGGYDVYGYLSLNFLIGGWGWGLWIFNFFLDLYDIYVLVFRILF